MTILLLALTGWASPADLEYEIHDDVICFPLDSAAHIATALEYYHVYWGTNQLYSNEMLAMSNRIAAYSNQIELMDPGRISRRQKSTWAGVGAGGILLLRLLILALI